MTLIWTWMLCKRTCWTSLKVLQSVWLRLLIIIHVKQCLTDCKGLIGPLCLLSSRHSCSWGAGWFVITPTWCVRKLTLRQVKWLTQAYAIHRCQKWELNPGPRVLIHCLPSLPEKTAADRTSWEPAMTKAIAVMDPELWQWQETAVGGGDHENGVPSLSCAFLQVAAPHSQQVGRLKLCPLESWELHQSAIRISW